MRASSFYLIYIKGFPKEETISTFPSGSSGCARGGTQDRGTQPLPEKQETFYYTLTKFARS